MKSGIFIDNFVMNQLKLGNFSTRGLHVTFHTMKAAFIYPDHIFGKNDCRNGSKDLVSMFIIIRIEKVVGCTLLVKSPISLLVVLPVCLVHFYM